MGVKECHITEVINSSHDEIHFLNHLIKDHSKYLYQKKNPSNYNFISIPPVPNNLTNQGIKATSYHLLIRIFLTKPNLGIVLVVT